MKPSSRSGVLKSKGLRIPIGISPFWRTLWATLRPIWPDGWSTLNNTSLSNSVTKECLPDNKLTPDLLYRGNQIFRAILDASPLGIFAASAQGDCLYTNEVYQQIFGLTPKQSLAAAWIEAVHPEDSLRICAQWRDARLDKLPVQSEFRILRKDGRVTWVRVNSSAVMNGTARINVQIVEDITERKLTEFGRLAVEDALFDEKERAQVTLNSIGDAVLATDVAGKVTYLNPVAERMTGWSRKEALGLPLMEVFNISNEETGHVVANPALHAIHENQTVSLVKNCVLIRRDGFVSHIDDSAAPIHNRKGEVTGAVIVFHDVSQSRAVAKKMSHLAQHDLLTELPNRGLLKDRLLQSLGMAHRNKKLVALLFLDLDHFKNINDSLGHAIGDQLLQSVASRLSSCIRNTDTVSRHGGDEFVILLAEIEHTEDASRVAQILLDAFAAPHPIEGHELYVTLSIGISIYPDDGIDVDTMIQNADTAMYHAKKLGRGRHQFFKAEMNAPEIQRMGGNRFASSHETG